MTDVVMPRPRAGYRLVGYGPRTGMLCDAAGRIILDGQYEPIGKAKMSTDPAQSVNQISESVTRIERGVRPTQETLL